jgi:DNA-binding HxlR family transcriptional regulator
MVGEVMTQQLRDLERDGILKRRVYAEVPPREEYSATPLARTLRSVLLAMHGWAGEYLLKETPGPKRKKRLEKK